jgi:hypothetical protein
MNLKQSLRLVLLSILFSVCLFVGANQKEAYSQEATSLDANPGKVFFPLAFTNHKAEPPLLTWQKLNKNLPDDWVRDIAINPANQDIIISFRNNGLYKSTDLGYSWREVYGYSHDNNPFTREVEFSKSNPDIVYAGKQTDVLRSEDGGETWVKTLPREIPGGGWALAVDPIDPYHVFVGINYNAPYHIYETHNGGETWEPGNLTLPAEEGVISIAFDPYTPDKLFAGGNTDVADHPQSTRLYVSIDDADSWTLVENGFPYSKRIMAINFNPCTADELIIARQKHAIPDQYIRSTEDGGDTWESEPLVDDAIDISPLSPCPIYTAMHRNLNDGSGWEDISYNFYDFFDPEEQVRFSVWAADPVNDILWVGTREHGIYFIHGVVPSD